MKNLFDSAVMSLISNENDHETGENEMNNTEKLETVLSAPRVLYWMESTFRGDSYAAGFTFCRSDAWESVMDALETHTKAGYDCRMCFCDYCGRETDPEKAYYELVDAAGGMSFDCDAEKPLFYAAMFGSDDTDYGKGSFYLYRAEEIARDYLEDGAYIAALDVSGSSPYCVEEIPVGL